MVSKKYRREWLRMWWWLFTILVVIMIIAYLPEGYWRAAKIAPFINGEPSRLAQVTWKKTTPAQVITLQSGYLILEIGELPVLTRNGKIIFAKIQLAYLSQQSAQINTQGFRVVLKQTLTSDLQNEEEMSPLIASMIASVWQQQPSTYCALVNLDKQNHEIANPQKNVSEILQAATNNQLGSGKDFFQQKVFYSFSHNLPLIMP